MKNILITGANFDNQGAYMMLVAAAHGIRDKIGAQPVIDVRWGTVRQKRREGLDTLVSIDELGPARSLGINLASKRIRERSPALSFREIDGVIDVSGFAFGDQWSHARLTARAKRFSFFASRGIKVVIMPQAFGPFEKTAESGRIVLQSAELVYARDPESARHLEKLSSGDTFESKKVRVRPDFTVGLPSRRPYDFNHDLTNTLIVVPNANIAARGNREQYLRVLRASVEFGRRNGMTPAGLIHDTGADRQLFAELASRGVAIDTFDGLDGLAAKWVLGQAKMVVSGRFHASVSALAGGVPTVIHGWSHKYDYLATDFGVEHLLASPYSAEETTDRLEVIRNSSIAARIASRKLELTASTAEMWDEVAEVFNQ